MIDTPLHLTLEPGLRVMIGRDGQPSLIEATDARVMRCTLDWRGSGRRGAQAVLSLGTAADMARTTDRSDTSLTLTFVGEGPFRGILAGAGEGDFYMGDALAALATAAAAPAIQGAARDMYRRAKCQELLCEILEAAERGDLVPHTPSASLSRAEMERLMSARRLIADRFDEKLTLDQIARTAGLNRTKLTQGFREVFGQSVADCLADQRLSRAARDLTSSDRPVSVVGYDAGYLNNASFARAFTRRYGLCPSDYRRAGGQVALNAA
ncbi:MAG: AraC family transcriptional regulator [Alphaproteobacteria bacterium]|nr:AraC family transcriptional regulator [Alphaproteobacteria bacterium]